MPTQPYRQALEQIDALQYNGTNKSEMLSFAPGFVIDDNGTLMIARNPYPLLNTEWVTKHWDNSFKRWSDAEFGRKWQHGGGPA
jgi:hypothetical protein